MTKSLRCLLIVAILCGCSKHYERNTFKETSKIKTYTYAEACDLSEDSEGFYNFFLLPDISPAQAYAFERQFAKEQGLGYNVYTGAHPYTVDALIYVDISEELFQAYIKTLVAHRKAKNKKYSTFRAAIKYYVELYNSIQTPANVKKYGSQFPAILADAEKALLGLLLLLEDDHSNNEDYLIHNAWRLLDRVKFHRYRKQENLY